MIAWPFALSRVPAPLRSTCSVSVRLAFSDRMLPLSNVTEVETLVGVLVVAFAFELSMSRSIATPEPRFVVPLLRWKFATESVEFSWKL